MCRIVATVSPAANIIPALLEGLLKLKYRSYGSAGIAVLNGAGVERVRTAGRAAELAAPAKGVELGQYRHCMRKEIFEQLQALANSLEFIGNGGQVQPDLFGADAADRRADMRSVLILACCTRCPSGVTAHYWLEALAGAPNDSLLDELKSNLKEVQACGCRNITATCRRSARAAAAVAGVSHRAGEGEGCG